MIAEKDPVHLRSIRLVFQDAGDSLKVWAELRDERPWAKGTHQEVLHAMVLEVTVDFETREILTAGADMDRYPHAECPMVTASYGRLVGLVIGKGFRQAVTERVGSTQGCAHLVELCRALAPGVMQALQSRKASLSDEGTGGRSIGWATGMCHVLAPGGAAQQKMQAGWQPGVGEYPVPPVEAFPLTAPDGDAAGAAEEDLSPSP